MESRNDLELELKPKTLAHTHAKTLLGTWSTIKVPIVPKMPASTKRQGKSLEKGSSLKKKARK